MKRKYMWKSFKLPFPSVYYEGVLFEDIYYFHMHNGLCHLYFMALLYKNWLKNTTLNLFVFLFMLDQRVPKSWAFWVFMKA